MRAASLTPVIRALILTGTVVLASCSQPQTMILKNTRSLASFMDTDKQARGAQAYRTTVYPLARTNCASCHGAAQAPKFATTDVFSSFQAAVPKANFADIPASALVKKSQDGHCGTDGCRTNGPAMTTAIRQWKELWDASATPTQDPPTGFSWHAAAEVADETANKVTLTIDNGYFETDTSVEIELTGTATPGEDYLPLANARITIPAFQRSTTVDIMLLNDNLYEGEETIVATLRNPSSTATLGAQTIAVATLIDDEQVPTVQWEAPSIVASEGSAPVIAKAVLSGPSVFPISAQVQFSGSATAVTDYTVAGNTVTFAPRATTANYTITIVNDLNDEDEENIIATLANPQGATLGTQTTYTIAVPDNDDPPFVRFLNASQAVTEGVATVTANIVVSPAASTKNIIIPYTVGGTATPGTDHNLAATGGMLMIPANSPSGTLSFQLTNDTLYEPLETIVITLQTPVNGQIDTNFTHTVNVTDNENPPVVEVAQPLQQTVNEAVQAASIPITITPAHSQVMTLGYTLSGTQLAAPVTTSIQIPAGATTFNIPVTFIDDDRDNADRTLILTMNSVSGGATLGANKVHTVNVHNDDPAPSIAWTMASQMVSETGGTVTVNAILSKPSGRNISVQYSVAGTASNPADHNLAAGTLSIPAGSDGGSVSFMVASDSLVEPDETVILTLNTPTNVTVGSPSIHTVTITDGPVPPNVQIVEATKTVAEAVGSVAVTFRLNSTQTSNVVVPYTVSGSATSGVDFTALSGSATILAGQLDAVVNVAITNDGSDETDETIILTLTPPGGGIALGANTSETITITDDDLPPRVSFAAANVNLPESAGSQTLTLNLEDPASAFPIAIPFAVTGTATSPADHSLMSGTINIPAGQSSGSVNYSIVNDLTDELAETIVVSLGVPSAPVNARLGTTPVQTITIADDDNPPTAGFDIATQSVSENVGTVVLRVNLQRASTFPISINYAVTGTAQFSSDHTLANGTLNIAAGADFGEILLPIVDDTKEEPTETVIVTLSNPVNATLAGNLAETVNITNNDLPPKISWTAATQPSVSEGTASVTITATLDHRSFNPVSASIALSGTATLGADYQFAANSISIPADALTATVTMTIIDDTVDENDEAAILTLNTPVNGTLGITTQHTVTIVSGNDLPPTVAWSAAAQTVAENQAGASARVTLVGGSQKTITVPYTVSGTAVSGTDYVLSSGNITIPPSTPFFDLPLSLVNDTIPEPSDKKLVLTLNAPTNATLGGTKIHTATITDDDLMTDPKAQKFRETVYVITRRDCVGCHGAAITPFHASTDISLAYAVAKTKANNFANLTSAPLYTRVVTDHGGCGAACMKDGTEMLAALQAWADVENAGNTNTSTGAVLVTADTRLRAGNRYYVKTMLDEIFGSATAGVPTNELFLAENSLFGGPCDHYGTKLDYGAPVGNCATPGDSQIPLIPGAVSGRYSLTIRACERILSSDTAVRYAAAQAMGVPTSPLPTLAFPNSANVTGAYGLFYPGLTPSAQVVTDLQGVSQAAQAAGYNANDAWRYMLLSLCRAPDWQVP